MQAPRPLSDPFLRRSLLGTAAAGLLATGSLAAAAAFGPAGTTRWITVGLVALAYGSALFVTLTSYRIGWWARVRSEQERTTGRWMAYPVDEDGIPVSVPVTGRLVVDEPEGQ